MTMARRMWQTFSGSKSLLRPSTSWLMSVPSFLSTEFYRERMRDEYRFYVPYKRKDPLHAVRRRAGHTVPTVWNTEWRCKWWKLSASIRRRCDPRMEKPWLVRPRGKLHGFFPKDFLERRIMG